jgi:hypothetical protein
MSAYESRAWTIHGRRAAADGCAASLLHSPAMKQLLD